MGYQKRISSYESVKFETANPGKLIVMLYERLGQELKKAKAALKTEDYETKGAAIVLSQDIIMELNNSLNMDAGTIATNLRALYIFMYKELNQINFSNNGESLEGLIEVVENLHGSWEEIADTKPAAVSGKNKEQQNKVENLSLVG